VIFEKLSLLELQMLFEQLDLWCIEMSVTVVQVVRVIRVVRVILAGLFEFFGGLLPMA
jgi:hypothetical protein